jgi:hypothetical protein
VRRTAPWSPCHRQMPEDMAVHIPQARIVCVEGHRQAALRSHEHRISEGAIQLPPVDIDDLQRVAIKVPRMRHTRFIDKLNADPLSLPYPHLRFFRPTFFPIEGLAVDVPLVLPHVALQPQYVNLIDSFRRQRGKSYIKNWRRQGSQVGSRGTAS